MAEGNKQWYVLRAISGKEAKVKEVLDAAIKNSGYVFIEAQLTGEVIYELRNTTNVIDFLRGRAKNAAPEALRESEVKKMLGAADAIAQGSDMADMDYIVGETVTVTFGPFKGFHGVVRDVNRDRKKLKVEVKVFERPVDLELENSQVEGE